MSCITTWTAWSTGSSIGGGGRRSSPCTLTQPPGTVHPIQFSLSTPADIIENKGNDFESRFCSCCCAPYCEEVEVVDYFTSEVNTLTHKVQEQKELTLKTPLGEQIS